MHSGRPAANGAKQALLWPKPNDEQIEAIVKDGVRVADFWQGSPVSMQVGESRADEVIDILFPGNPWLCIGHSQRKFHTDRREKWRGELENCSLIVPSPMTSQSGLTKSGRKSCHCLNNAGPRCFLIIELDRGNLDHQAAVIGHLARCAPLAAIVFSGGKSLHGWFVCDRRSEETLLNFMKYAVSLGADKTMWLPSQFCRIPDGRRSGWQAH